MSKTFTRNVTAAAVAIAVHSMSGQALAQDDDTFALEEIIVTAQKREQSLQDVPSTVNAIQGDALTDKKLFNFQDLEQVSPGLEMRNINGRAGSIALRGVDFNPNSGASAAVDVYWNDVTLGTNASGGVFQEMFDLGRVEVLRGPQGTLQGRTSPGGAIAIHTAKPDMEEIEGYVRTTFTDNSGTNTQFASSLPIIPGELSMRVAGVYNESDLQEVKNYVDGDESDSQTEGGRISLSWQPSDEFSADLVYQYLENDVSNYATLVGTSTLSQGLPALNGSDFESIQTQPDLFNGRFENLSVKLEWEVLEHQVTFLSGYSEVSSVRDFDNAVGNTQLGFTPFTAPHPLASFSQIGRVGSQLNSPQRQLDQNYASSQELRIASIDNEFWDYTVGVYYGSESGFFRNEAMREQTLFGPASLYFNGVTEGLFDFESYGVFAHNIFYLTDQWTAQVGIRWQRQERDSEANLFALEDVIVTTGAPFNPVQAFAEGELIRPLLPDNGKSTDNSEAWTGSLSLQYAFADYDASAYINASTSFRPGGVVVSSRDLGDLIEYNEEDSWSVEVGVKSSWLDNRLRLNTSVFYQDYSDYIGRANRIALNPMSTANGGEASITTNGDARVQGVEVDFEYLIAENWHLAGGVSYVEAEYKDGVTVPSNECGFQGNIPVPQCDVSGLELGTQAPFTASLSTDYTIPMDAFDIYMLGLYKFTGRRTDTDAPSGDLGGYGTFDLHLGLREASATWDVSLFVRNLFDKEATDNIQPEFQTFGEAPITTTGYYKTTQIAPRLIGLSATYNF